MFPYLHAYQFWLVVPIILLALGLGLTAGLVTSIAFDRGAWLSELSGRCTLGVTFSFFGAVVGFMAGNSRAPVIGELIPAALSLAGAFAIYIVAKSDSTKSLAVISLLTLSLSIFIGAIWGSEHRDSLVNSDAALDHKARLVRLCLFHEANVNALIAAEFSPHSRPLDWQCAEYPIQSVGASERSGSRRPHSP